jgi:Family of unknown function (DUF5947)
MEREQPTGDVSAYPALRRFVRRQTVTEHCDLCGREVPEGHDHLIEPVTRQISCSCGPCAVLFSAQADMRYRRIPRDVRVLSDFQLTDMQWEALRLPIELAFFFHGSPQGKTMAFYPGPAGVTESMLSLEAWNEIVAVNPILARMQPDVEALMVDRTKYAKQQGPAEYYLLPIDECFRLVGIIRANWRGFFGGKEVWEEIDGFFESMRRRGGSAAPRGSAAMARTGDAHA